MKASIKNMALPEVPALNREYKKRPKPVTGTGKFIKVLETNYKPTPPFVIPPEIPERRKRIIESNKESKERRKSPKRVWTPERVEEFKRLHAEGLTYAEMADAMHMRPSQISSEAHLLRSQGEIGNRIACDLWSEEEIKTLHQMRADGKSYKKIAVALGRTAGSVEARLRREDEKKWLN